MAELRWIKLYLFLILKLQLKVFADRSAALIRSGDTMVFSCQCLISGQKNCNGTTWIFSSRSPTVELVTLGKIDPNLQSKSNRLSLKSCSLVIRNVTVEDAGYYHCQQYKSGNKSHPHVLVNQCGVDLSVVHITKQKDRDKVTLTCSVKTYGWCDYKVKWQPKCPAGAPDVKHCESKEPDCSAAVCFVKQSYMQGCKFRCEVTHGGTSQLFNFSNPSLKNKSVETKAETTHSPTREKEKTTKPGPTTTESSNGLSLGAPYIAAAVVLVIFFIVVGSIITWRIKRNKRQVQNSAGNNLKSPVSPNDVEPSLETGNPEDVYYSTIREDRVVSDLAMVTYSTVGAPSRSIAASTESNSIYSVIHSLDG